MLHVERLGPDDAAAAVLFTHGAYGSGANWRSIARQVIAQVPGWAALLVDLRLHGRSPPGAPPHTLAACVDDLRAVIAATATPVTAAVGHSLGGKVVLALDGVARRVVLDSTPSARPDAWEAPANSVRAAWESMAALDRSWARRDDFVAALMARGHAAPLAGWLAMNLAPGDGGLRLRLELDGVRELILDYYQRDLWPAIEAPTGAITMVVAEHGHTVSAPDLVRLRAAPPLVTTHVLPDVGHWLHLDAPTAVVAHVAAALADRPSGPLVGSEH